MQIQALDLTEGKGGGGPKRSVPVGSEPWHSRFGSCLSTCLWIRRCVFKQLFLHEFLALLLRWLQGGDGSTSVVPVCAGAVACTIQFVSADVPPNRVRHSQSLLALIGLVARLESLV